MEGDKAESIFSGRSIPAVVVAIAAMLAYAPSIGSGLFWDSLRASEGASRLVHIFEQGYHRPLSVLFFDAERYLLGEWTAGYHLVNVLLHASNAVLVFFVSCMLVGRHRASFLAGLVFAAHPACVEAVSWVFAMPWLLSTFFGLWAVLLYLFYLRDGLVPAIVASALFFLLAALSEQAALALPSIVFLHALTVRMRWKRLGWVLGLYSAALAVYLAFYSGPGVFFPESWLKGVSLVSPIEAMGYYFVKMAIPFGLRALPAMPGNVVYIVAGLGPLALFFLFYSEGLRREAAAILSMYLLLLPGALVPMSEAAFPLGMRYAYLCIPAFSMLVAMLVGRLSQARLRMALTVLIPAVLVSGSLYWSYHWSREVTLWRETAEQRKERALPFINYGATLVALGEYAAADESLALALARDDIGFWQIGRIMTLYDEMGHQGETRVYDALVSARGRAKAEYAMGFLYLKRFESDRTRSESLPRAVEYLERSVKTDDGFHGSHYYLGLAYVYLKRLEDAAHEFRRVKALDLEMQYRDDVDYYLLLLNTVVRVGEQGSSAGAE